MSQHDDHVQHTWNLTRETDGDQMSIDLWTDDESVRVNGGEDESCDGGRKLIEEKLLPKYWAAGYRVTSDYQVNEPYQPDEEADAEEPDGKPEQCPECLNTDVEYVANHCTDLREGQAWLCTQCRWGQWVVA